MVSSESYPQRPLFYNGASSVRILHGICTEALDYFSGRHGGDVFDAHARQVRAYLRGVVLAEVISSMEPSGGSTGGWLVSLGDLPGIHH